MFLLRKVKAALSPVVLVVALLRGCETQEDEKKKHKTKNPQGSLLEFLIFTFGCWFF